MKFPFVRSREFPMYQGSYRSLKKLLLAASLQGNLARDAADRINVRALNGLTLDIEDGDRIGVWGLSYGGYMVLQSLVVDPPLFNCAIDVAGVGDWETYNQGTSTRLGTNASADPALWDRSAPGRHLDKLERPLLILQGTADVNVPFWETLKIVDSLEKLGKPFDLMIYPGEPHWFRRSYVLRDAWRRSEAFFNMHLIPDEVEETRESKARQ